MSDGAWQLKGFDVRDTRRADGHCRRTNRTLDQTAEAAVRSWQPIDDVRIRQAILRVVERNDRPGPLSSYRADDMGTAHGVSVRLRHVATRVRSAAAKATEIVVGRRKLAACDVVGRWSRVRSGRAIIDNAGRIEIGARTRLTCNYGPIELRTAPGARLTIGSRTAINFTTLIDAAERIEIGDSVEHRAVLRHRRRQCSVPGAGRRGGADHDRGRRLAGQPRDRAPRQPHRCRLGDHRRQHRVGHGPAARGRRWHPGAGAAQSRRQRAGRHGRARRSPASLT